MTSCKRTGGLLNGRFLYCFYRYYYLVSHRYYVPDSKKKTGLDHGDENRRKKRFIVR
jgi:hypothetical protein